MPKPTFKDFEGYLEKHKDGFPPEVEPKLEPHPDAHKVYRKDVLGWSETAAETLYWKLFARKLEEMAAIRAVFVRRYDKAMKRHILREARKWLRKAWTEWLCEYLDA